MITPVIPMRKPADIVDELERKPELPPGSRHLRDFAIPQRGLFVVGRTFFDDTRRA